MKQTPLILLTLAALALCALSTPASAQDVVYAGNDAWMSPPEGTCHAFGNPGNSGPCNILSVPPFPPGPQYYPLIPAGFFGPGSLPFEGWIHLVGAPFREVPQVDTVLERSADAVFPACGIPVSVPLKMVALHLRSYGAILVHYSDGSTSRWNVDVTLSQVVDQPEGTIQLTKTCSAGGEYSASFPVVPRFVFTPRTRGPSGGSLVLDFGDYYNPADPCLYGDPTNPNEDFFAICFTLPSGNWAFNPSASHELIRVPAGARVDGDGDGVLDAPLLGTSNFTPGVSVDSCADCVTITDPTDTLEQNVPHIVQYLRHGVTPPRYLLSVPALSPWGISAFVMFLAGIGAAYLVSRRG